MQEVEGFDEWREVAIVVFLEESDDDDDDDDVSLQNEKVLEILCMEIGILGGRGGENGEFCDEEIAFNIELKGLEKTP